MPRPTRHQGSGRLSVIPERWNEDHAAVIAQTLPAVVVVAPTGPPAWNPTTKQTEATLGTRVYDGSARITAVTSPPGGPAAVVDEQVPVRIYEVVLPYEVDTTVPSLVIDVTSSRDAMLTGRRLHLDEVDRGDNRFSRVLIATLSH